MSITTLCDPYVVPLYGVLTLAHVASSFKPPFTLTPDVPVVRTALTAMQCENSVSSIGSPLYGAVATLRNNLHHKLSENSLIPSNFNTNLRRHPKNKMKQKNNTICIYSAKLRRRLCAGSKRTGCQCYNHPTTSSGRYFGAIPVALIGLQSQVLQRHVQASGEALALRATVKLRQLGGKEPPGDCLAGGLGVRMGSTKRGKPSGMR